MFLNVNKSLIFVGGFAAVILACLPGENFYVPHKKETVDVIGTHMKYALLYSVLCFISSHHKNFPPLFLVVFALNFIN